MTIFYHILTAALLVSTAHKSLFEFRLGMKSLDTVR